VKPNILYIHSHDTGRYVQPYGVAVPTPNIQKLAEGGILFTHAFCAAPTCSPSRAALLTGQAPHSCGQFGLVNRGFKLRDKEKHIANLLKTNGYFTALAGIHHVVRDPLSCGYMKHLNNENDDKKVSDKAVKFLNNTSKKPFFLSVGFFNTHRKHLQSKSEDELYCAPPRPFPNTPETRKDMASFMASTRVLDKCIGKVLNALKKNGLIKNTLVICTTDHGIPFPKMKCNLTDHGTGVMLIIRGPKGFSNGRVCDALISQIDIFPTICEVIGIKKPDWLQGKSILPLIKGNTKEINKEIYSEINFHAAYEPLRSIRTKRWKYIRRYTKYRRPVMANIDGCPTKNLLFKYGYSKQIFTNEELYDLIFDPNEACNLLNSSIHSKTLNDMRSHLDRWMKKTNDPLLKGPISAPKTAILSDMKDSDPSDIWQRRKKSEGYA
jgi:arylsulfatase A-like enzyme